jgi:hypothetical protein
VVGSVVHSALERAKRAAQLSGGSLLVGVSGGKDSLCTLDVCVRSGAFQRIELFAMYLVPGLECFEGPVRRVADRYKLPVHFVPHWDLARLIKHAVLRPHVLGAKDIRLQKVRDVERALTMRTGIDFFAYGERAADSVVRRIYTSEHDGVHPYWRRLWPIWDWCKPHIKAYLKARRLPVPEQFGKRKATGISLSAVSLALVRKYHPNDFRKILEVFPYAETQVIRLERGDYDHYPGVADALPELFGRTAAPKTDSERAVQPEADSELEQGEAQEGPE